MLVAELSWMQRIDIDRRVADAAERDRIAPGVKGGATPASIPSGSNRALRSSISDFDSSPPDEVSQQDSRFRPCLPARHLHSVRSEA